MIAEGQHLTRAQALKLGLTHYISKNPCKNGHQWYRNVKYTDCMACQKTLSITDRVKHLYKSKKAQCKKQGISFNIELSDIIIPESCPVYGNAFDWNDAKMKPTLDRYLPELGYTKGNIMVISAKANRLKSNATLSDILKLADYMRHQARQHGRHYKKQTKRNCK